MPRPVTHLAVYFMSPGSAVGVALITLVKRMIEIAPEIRLAYVGERACAGRFSRDIANAVTQASRLLVEPVANHPDRTVSANFKDGRNGTFLASYHLVLSAGNCTSVRNIPIPNYLRLSFPDADQLEQGKLDAVLSWFLLAVESLDACYAYLNPAVLYDEYRVDSENQPALDLLNSNPVLDLFEDYNQLQQFGSRVKGAMWLTVLGSGHLAALPSVGLDPVSPFISTPLPGGRLMIRLRLPLGHAPTPERLAAYRSLASHLSPLFLESFDPIMFRFPYRYPIKQSTEWLRRFLVPEARPDIKFEPQH